VGSPAFQLPAETDRVVILVNPKAGRRSAAVRTAELTELLRQRRFDVQVLDDLAEACVRADRLHTRRELRALVGVGGDGTAAELATRTQPGVPVTLLAAGTANLLAKQFGLSSKPEKVAGVIAGANCHRMDAGRAGGRVFLSMVSCGLDADVVRRVHAQRGAGGASGHIGYATYLKPIFDSIRNYEYPQMRVYCDEPCDDRPSRPVVEPVVARWAFVFNLSRYGWGLRLAPEADFADGRLDLCTFGKGSLWHGLRYLAAAQFGAWHGRLGDCSVRQARRIRITSDRPAAYQLDGDPGGELPVDIEVLPGRLTLVVPPMARAALQPKGLV